MEQELRLLIKDLGCLKSFCRQKLSGPYGPAIITDYYLSPVSRLRERLLNPPEGPADYA